MRVDSGFFGNDIVERVGGFGLFVVGVFVRYRLGMLACLYCVICCWRVCAVGMLMVRYRDKSNVVNVNLIWGLSQVN